MRYLQKKEIFGFFNNKITLFIFAFLLMATYLFPFRDLIPVGSDGAETWKVVTTFFSTDPYHSYVMYKGFLAFIPNVVFYQLSLFFKLDPFFFVKLFNCFGFAYIATIGIPYFFTFIFGKKIECYKIYISTLILYFGLRVNFSFISVDFPSILVMFLAVNSAIRIKISEKKLPLIYYVYTGVIFSMGASLSGQYLPTVIFAVIFLLFSKVIPLLKLKKIRFRFFAILACLILGFSSINISNNYFIKTRVQPAREAGEWIPTGEDWLKWGLTAMLTTKYDNNDLKLFIPDNRGRAILLKEKADIQSIEKGGSAYSYKEDMHLALRYPIDFMTRWMNRLFLGISVDDNSRSFVYLFISYTLLFLSVLTLKRGVQKIKDIFDSRIFLILALVTPSLIPIVLHVEMRYFMSIQILIIGAALLSGTFWKAIIGFKDFAILTIENLKNTSSAGSEIFINYSLFGYMIFMVLCFLLFATQYELVGPNPDILFHF